MRWFFIEMTLPCVCELTTGGPKPPAGLRQLFELTHKGARRIQLRASSPQGKSRISAISAAPHRMGWPSCPMHRPASPVCTSEDSQQNEHTRISDLCISSADLRKKPDGDQRSFASLWMTAAFQSPTHLPNYRLTTFPFMVISRLKWNESAEPRTRTWVSLGQAGEWLIFDTSYGCVCQRGSTRENGTACGDPKAPGPWVFQTRSRSPVTEEIKAN